MLNLRDVLRHAYKIELLPTRRLEEAVEVPRKNLLERHDRQREQKFGSKAFTHDELRAVLEAAPPVLKAMILLGVNAAFEPTDLAHLPQSVLDLKRGWVTFPRVKTSVARRAKLWPETVASLQAARAVRPNRRVAQCNLSEEVRETQDRLERTPGRPR